jgi:hypothetical protein
MISEERKQWMHEHELRVHGRYYWKFWLWLAVELAGAGLFVYVIIIRK